MSSKNFLNRNDRLKITGDVEDEKGIEFQETLSNENNYLKEHEVVEIEKQEACFSVDVNSNVNGVTNLMDSNDNVKPEILKLLESPDSTDEVLLFNLNSYQQMPILSQEDLQELSTKCINRSAVVVLESQADKSFSIIWKHKEFPQFWVLNMDKKLEADEKMKLKEFVAEFITESLKIHNTGLFSGWNKQRGTKMIEIDYLADSRDYNLLLLATERGNADIVEILLKLKVNTKSLNNTVDSRNLAIEHEHQDILLIFLKANMAFPASFDSTKCTGKLKQFCDITRKLHQLVIDDNVEELEELLNQQKGMNIFYNFQNHSAVRIAVQNQSYDAYKLLLSRNFRFAPNEVPKDYFQGLRHDERRKLREIHNTYSDHLVDKHVNILMANSHIFQDRSDGQDKRHIIQRAFEVLNSNPFIQILLKIVAAYLNFKIIFDFNRETIDIVDPTADEYTEGMFYLSGRIYVAAKQLLDKTTENEALGVIAHELCHFAMNLVFKNDAKPFRSSDKKTTQEFEEIYQECEERQEKERLIELVYDYPREQQYAELIVRVVHLQALYHNHLERLKEVSEIFSRLFNFYGTKVVPELEKALPKIESRESKKDKKIYKLKRWLCFGTIASIVLIVAVIFGTRWLLWTCQYDKLTDTQQRLIENGDLRYESQNIKFQDLFSVNTTAYRILNSENCSALLSGRSLNFGSENYHYLYEHVSKDSQIIRKKVLNAAVIYGNSTVQFHDLFADDSDGYDKISRSNISEILKEHALNFTDMTYLYEFASVKSQYVRQTLSQATVLYKNVEIQMHTLFPENSEVYSQLDRHKFAQVLKGYILDLSNPDLKYITDQVNHSWGNLTEKLKDVFLGTNFVFQNENVQFQEMFKVTPKSFDSLTSQQIIDALDGKTLHLHDMIKNRTKFYVERNFWDENIFEIYFDYMQYTNGGYNWLCWFLNKTNASKTFDEFYSEFKAQSFNVQVQKINDIRKSRVYKWCVEDSNFEIKDPNTFAVVDSLFDHKTYQMDFDEVLNEVNKSRMFILSSEAGAGKTVNFEQFALRIKKKYPTHWVSYIDLRDFKQHYNQTGNLEDIQSLLENIMGLSSQNEFQRNVFWELYDLGYVILLWNGFDEISPQYSEFILNTVSSIFENSNNIQFICTRPLYKEQLRIKLESTVHILLPFNYETQVEFLTKLFINKEIPENKIGDYVQKVQKIVIAINPVTKFETPLLLGMIAELIANDVEIYKSENLYEIYEKFIYKKIDVWGQTSEFGREFQKNYITKYRYFDMMKLYQKYAINSELGTSERYKNLNKLKIVSQEVPDELTNDEISRMGILYINDPENVKFAHKSYAEFFIAQFLIENIFLEKNPVDQEEAETRLELLQHIVSSNYDTTNHIVNFMNHFLQTKVAKASRSFHPSIRQALKSKYRKIFFAWIGYSRYMPKLSFLLDFFKKDHQLLVELLHVDDSETLYTASFNYYRVESAKIDHKALKDLTQKYLNPNEFEKFIHGRNQKGVILYSLFCFHAFRYFDVIHDEYALDDELLNSNDKFQVFYSIVDNITKEELNELLVRDTSPLYEKDTIQFHFKKEFWDFIDKNFSEPQELKNLFMGIGDGHKIWFDYNYAEKIFANKILHLDAFMNDTEIYEFFSIKNLFLSIEIYFSPELFADLWQFFLNHTEIEQQRNILNKTDTHDSWNILQKLLFYDYIDNPKFGFIFKTFQDIFTTSEIQELIFRPNYFFLELFARNSRICDYQLNKVKEIFLGSEDVLKDKLEKRVGLKNLSVFELFKHKKESMVCYKQFNELYNFTTGNINTNNDGLL